MKSIAYTAAAIALALFVAGMLGLRFLVTGINADFGEGYALGFISVPVLLYIATRGGHAKLF